MEPLISVIIPCYNQARYLSDAVESVISQTYTNWECIIVNDGSPDDTKSIAEYYLAKDNRIKYVEKKNGGLSSARNAGVKVAKGQFLQLLDADDVILESKFEEQIRILLRSKADVCICDYKKIDFDTKAELVKGLRSLPHETEILKEFLLYWENRLSIPCHCIIFKKEIITSNKISFNEKLPNHEDWTFWVELFMVKPTYCCINKVLCHYHYIQDSMCADRKLMYKGFNKAIRYIKRKYKYSKTEPNLNEYLDKKKHTIKEIYQPRKKNRIKIIRRKITFRLQLLLTNYKP